LSDKREDVGFQISDFGRLGPDIRNPTSEIREGISNAGNYHVPVQRMQESELLEHQEQENHDRADRTEEVLPQVPQTPTAQGNQVD
jgi:hypothetical protein